MGKKWLKNRDTANQNEIKPEKETVKEELRDIKEMKSHVIIKYSGDAEM